LILLKGMDLMVFILSLSFILIGSWMLVLGASAGGGCVGQQGQPGDDDARRMQALQVRQSRQTSERILVQHRRSFGRHWLAEGAVFLGAKTHVVMSWRARVCVRKLES
jgi:hypothetical protein